MARTRILAWLRGAGYYLNLRREPHGDVEMPQSYIDPACGEGHIYGRPTPRSDLVLGWLLRRVIGVSPVNR